MLNEKGNLEKRRKAMKKVIILSSVLVFALAAQGVVHAELFLPPAGEDRFPTTKLELEFVSTLGDTTSIKCAGPTTIQRQDPDSNSPTGGVIQTEILSMDLVCGGGGNMGLSRNPDPQFRSRGEVNEAGDSFFDVFFEVDLPQLGVQLHNDAAAVMRAKVDHVAPFHAIYLGAVPVPVFDQFGQLQGVITHLTHDTGKQTKPETTGEVSPVFSCFYECKPHRFSNAFWRETTSLMLVNQSTRQTLTAQVVLLDGNENILAIAPTQLSPLDLDEINICETLDQTGVPVPQAGVIEVVLQPGWGGAYGWVKDMVGGFKKGRPEPVDGFMRSVGKTECRLVGENVTTPFEILTMLDPALFVSPVLIEGTDDVPPPGGFCFDLADPNNPCDPCVLGTVCPDGVTQCGQIPGCP
jgi:hypothetical protein